jgi:hypothetical protein
MQQPTHTVLAATLFWVQPCLRYWCHKQSASRLAETPLKGAGAAQAPGRSALTQQIPRPITRFGGGSKKANAAAQKAQRALVREKQIYQAAKKAGKRLANRLAAANGSSAKEQVAAAAEAAYLKHFHLPSVQAEHE